VPWPRTQGARGSGLGGTTGSAGHTVSDPTLPRLRTEMAGSGWRDRSGAHVRWAMRRPLIGAGNDIGPWRGPKAKPGGLFPLWNLFGSI
jgi:hypothetical protein